MATTAITPAREQQGKLEKIKAYTQLPDVQERFADLLGAREGKAYVSAVYIAVLNSDGLQECSAKSIMIQAMRAASLKLSVDPSMRQAHLVPFGGHAQLIVDYHGLVMLMERTGLYDVIHVSEVYEGETVQVERFSGRCEVVGERKNDKIVGWIAYFKTKKGSEKFLYMTNEECDAHGQKYSKAFKSARSGWQTDRDAMRRKTALRCLCNKWGQYSPFDTVVLKNTEDIVDAESETMPDDSNIKLGAPAPRSKRIEAALVEEFGGKEPELFRIDSPEIVGVVADIAEVSMQDAQDKLLEVYKTPDTLLSMSDANKFAVSSAFGGIGPVNTYNDEPESAVVQTEYQKAAAFVVNGKKLGDMSADVLSALLDDRTVLQASRKLVQIVLNGEQQQEPLL